MRKNVIKKLIAIFLIFSLLVSLAGCSTINTSFENFRKAFFSNKDNDSIKIAVFEPMTGAYAQNGMLEISGIEVANTLYPTVCEKNIELVYIDSKSDLFEGEEKLEYNLTSDISGAIGSYGDVLTLLLAKKAEELSIPSLTVTSRNELVTINNKYAFTTTYVEESQGNALAKFGHENHKINHFAIIRVKGDDTTLSVAEQFKETLKNCEDVIVEEHFIDLDQGDFTLLIRGIQRNLSKGVLLLLPESLAKNFITQAKALSYAPLYLGTRSWDIDSMKKFFTDNSVDSAFCTEEIDFEKSTLGKLFKNKYTEMYQSVEISIQSAQSFDAYLLLRQAIQDALNEVNSKTKNEFLEDVVDNNLMDELGRAYDETKASGIPSGILIKNALMKIEKFQGVSGLISYCGTNRAIKDIAVTHIHNETNETTIIGSNDGSNNIEEKKE